MDVLMPQLGETVAEGKITKWFKSAGDAVKPGDNLFEIETDKVSMEVPSTIDRRAVGNPRRRGRGGAGRRDRGGDRGRGSGHAALRADGGGAAAQAECAGTTHQRVAGRGGNGSGDNGANNGANQARSVLRGAHARAQLWTGACRAARS